jgi:hypothetical protein
MVDIEINDLAQVGSIRDQEGYQLVPEAFTLADNMRFSANGVERIGGRSQVFGTPLFAPHFLLPIQSAAQQVFWIYTSLTGAAVYDGATHTDITRTLGPYGAGDTKDWNGLVFGGTPILNNLNDDPQAWLSLSPGTKLVKLPNWPANTKAKILRSLGSFLIAFNINKNGTLYPHMVKWSHPADPGTVPISWDPADETLDAGENDLPDVNAGVIQDALPLRGQMFIYKNNSVWRMRFVGGLFIFDFDTLLETAGLMTQRALTLTSDGQKHVFATQDDILIHNGTSAESILNTRFRQTLINAIDPVTYINSFMFTDPFRDECFFCYPERGLTNPNRAIVFNSRTGNLSETAVNFRNAAVGVIQVPSSTTWTSIGGTWDAVVGPWSINTRRKVVVCATDSVKFLQLDDGNTFDTTVFTGTLQRVGLGVVGRKRSGEWIVDFTKQKLVRRLWIKGSGGPFNVRVGFQALPDGIVNWTTPQSFDPITQKYIDVTGSGKAIAVEFSGTVPFRVAGYKPEIMLLGRF